MAYKQSTVEQAVGHNATLNTFAIVVAILESGVIYDEKAEEVADRIIKICTDEQRRQLKKFDVALARAAKESP